MIDEEFARDVQGRVEGMKKASAAVDEALAEVRKRWDDPEWEKAFVPRIRR